MEKRNLKNIAISLLLAFIAPGLQSQSVITKGEAASFYIITGASGSRQVDIAPDGRYLGCGSHIYDIEKDSIWKSEISIDLILSPMHYAGGGKIYKDGKIIEIETRSTSDDEWYGGVTLWAASRNLDTLYSMSYEEQKDPYSGTVRSMAYAYLVDGQTGKIMHRVEPHWPLSEEISNTGWGERVDGASDDGLILVGHSCWPGASFNWSPVFWDLEHDTSFFVGTEEDAVGTLDVVNGDGTIFSGAGKFYFYDRNSQTFTKEEIPLAPGMDEAEVTGISATGLAVMFQSAGATNREGYLYDFHSKELYSITDYVRELYGLESPISYFTPVDISDDGRIICGWSSYLGSDVPYCLVLADRQIFARPRSFSVTQYPGEMEVLMNWQVPVRGQYTLQGYNIYCDSVRINSALIPAEELSYVQAEGLVPDIHDYSIQAVYAEGVSAYSAPVRLLVVEENGCFPVQTIESHVTYNRWVNVYWGLPSSLLQIDGKGVKERSDDAHTVAQDIKKAPLDGFAGSSKTYVNSQLDLAAYMALPTSGYSCGVVIGNYLYAGKYGDGTICVYNLSDMSLADAFSVPDADGIANLVCVDEHLYVATQHDEILVVDMESRTISNRFYLERGMEVMHLCFIPDLDEGRGGFAYGGWNSLLYCDKNGQPIESGVNIDIDGINISGSVFL